MEQQALQAQLVLTELRVLQAQLVLTELQAQLVLTAHQVPQG
jgi:hypothetical protein